MAGITLYRSNSLERLADRFCHDVSSSPLPPLEQELVLVQSIGMGRWLSLSAAEHLGVWANVRYLYPNAFLDLVFGSVLKDYTSDHQASKHLISWRIMEELPRLAKNPVYAPLAGYMSDGSPIKLFQLSEKIADMYDQYVSSRTDMVLCWDRAEDVAMTGGGRTPLPPEDMWQSDLWRRLRSSLDFEHRGIVRERFIPALASRERIDGISRISIFGTSTLPPFHVGILEALSSVLEINMYLLSPTREYWGDIVSERDQIRRERKKRSKTSGDRHYSIGNPLLASMGELGRDFSEILSFCSDFDRTGDDDYLSSSDGSLLHRIQNDICELRDRSLETKGSVSPSDRSVQIHSCHSVMREVETLRDNLLQVFSEDSSLSPRDVLVMTPDIDIYAPYIEAVFGAPEDDELAIPYSIADRNVRARSTLIAPFLSLLAFNEKRFAASAVIDFISSVPVRSRWNFTDDDLTLIRGWVENAAMRWGVDAKDREEHSGISFGQNSFELGMRRLVSGYAMKEEGVLSDGILPAEYAEGSSAEILGSFAEIIEELSGFVRFMREPHPVGEWSSRLLHLLDALFEPGEEGRDECVQIRNVLRAMMSFSGKAGYAGIVDYRVVRDYLTSRLDETKTQFGFLNGRVTFCAILPMRSIPFKVICIMGLNDGAFPRVSKPLSFDLIARFPMQGDRSQRKDDRYLFLETILSARSVLYISHIGRSIRDNSPIPPSVLVSELIDYICAGYCLEGMTGGEKDAREKLLSHLVAVHRLHSFSKDYFSGGRLFSYSSSARRVSEASGTADGEYFPFLVPLESNPPESLLRVEPQTLQMFFSNPCRFFLRHRLCVIFRTPENTVTDEEPFEVDFHTGLKVQERIAGAVLEGSPTDRIRTRAIHSGAFPPGDYGAHLFDGIEADAVSLAHRAARFAGSRHIPARVRFEHDGILLDGVLPGVTEKGLVDMRGSLWGRDNFRIWLSHLCLCISDADGAERSTVFVTRDGGVRIPPVPEEQACAQLAAILSLYKKGISSPLKFFPKSSYAYAEAFHEEGKAGDARGAAAMKAAKAKWNPERETEGKDEKDDPCYEFCFGKEPPHSPGYPLDGEFADIALGYFGDFFALKGDLDESL